VKSSLYEVYGIQEMRNFDHPVLRMASYGLPVIQHS